MPHVKLAPAALRDLERLQAFLRSKNPAAAKRAAAAIIKALKTLTHQPQIGRLVENTEWRELLVSFGKSGYVALYRHDDDTVTVLALRHQKEAGYLPTDFKLPVESARRGRQQSD